MKLLKLWPGLEYLVRHGSFRAWLAAMFYAIFAMAVLFGTVIWENVLPARSQFPLQLLFGMTWILGICVSHRFEKAFQEAQLQHKKNAVAEDTLPLAQTEFLRQNFYESERLLRERLTRFPEDVPARFFLISVLKWQKRKNEALEQLTILETMQLGIWRQDLPNEKRQLLLPED